MKHPLRVYGEIHGIDPEKAGALAPMNEMVFHVRQDRIEVEYEGPWLDIEEDLDLIVKALAENGSGHVDFLDHDHWEIRRYRLAPGSWTCKRVDPDSVLEPLLRE